MEKARTSGYRVQFDELTEIITTENGDNISEGELYFWAQEKRRENLDHINSGHKEEYGLCRSCGNCRCDFKRFRCLCPAGKIFVTPYKIRSRF